MLLPFGEHLDPASGMAVFVQCLGSPDLSRIPTHSSWLGDSTHLFVPCHPSWRTGMPQMMLTCLQQLALKKKPRHYHFNWPSLFYTKTLISLQKSILMNAFQWFFLCKVTFIKIDFCNEINVFVLVPPAESLKPQDPCLFKKQITIFWRRLKGADFNKIG